MAKPKTIREKEEDIPDKTALPKKKPRKTESRILQTRKEFALRALEVVRKLKQELITNQNKLRLERMEFETIVATINGSNTKASSTIKEDLSSQTDLPKSNIEPSESSVAAPLSSLSSFPSSTSLSDKIVHNYFENYQF